MDVEGETRSSAIPLARRASASAVWLTAQTWITRLSGFITVAVLARLLSPAEFGVVAIAMTVLPMLYLVADLGFTTYLVQADSVDARLTTTTFWGSTLVGLALTGGLVVAALPVAMLMGAPEAAPVIAVMAPAVLIMSIGATPTALLRRQMRFRALSVQGAVAAVLGQAGALVMALSGAGVWALVAQILIAQTAGLIMVYATARWLPRGRPELSRLPHMLGFGSKVMGVDFAAMGRLWIENAVITRVLGVAALGQYGIAQRLVQTLRDLTGAAIAPVSTVVFARVRDDRTRLAEGYARAVRLTLVVTAPALSCLAVLAPVVVPMIYGRQWEQSVEPAAALAIAGILGLTATLDHGLFYGMGMPGRWLSYALIIEAVQLLVTVFCVGYGLAAVAWGFVAVSGVATVVRWVLVARLTGTRVARIVWLTLLPLAVIAVSILAGQTGYLLMGGGEGGFWRGMAAAAVAGGLVVGTHLLGVRLLLKDTWRDAVTLLAGRLTRRRHRVEAAS